MEICHVVVWGKLKRGEGKLKRKGEGELVSSKNYCKNKCEIYKQQFTYSILLIRRRGSGIFC